MTNDVPVNPLSAGINARSQLLSRIPASYRSEAAAFLELVAAEGLSLATMRAYVEDLGLRGLAVSTIRKHIAAMRQVVRAVFDSPELTDVQRWRLEKALAEISLPKRAKNAHAVDPNKLLSREEVAALQAGASRRSGVLLAFLIATGVRISEALAITLEDCREKEERVEVRVLGKGKRERKVRIEPALYREIRGVYAGTHYLFETKTGRRIHDRNVAKDFRRLGKRILGRHVTPHMLRHSFATGTIRRTGKLTAVSEYLGHSTVATTLDLYNHEILTDRELFGPSVEASHTQK